MALAALGSAFLLLFPGSAMAMADIDRALMQDLKHFQGATSVVLMFVPYGVRFVVRLDEGRLPDSSCVYQIDSIAGPTFDDVLRILSESVLEYQDSTPSLPGIQAERRELRLRFGLFFRFANRSQREFYFEDWEGKAKVVGYSGKYRILASADFPNRLRTLVTRPDVVLKGIKNLCPHS